MSKPTEPANLIAESVSMNYTRSSGLEWDDAKSKHCEEQRGFNFEYAAQALHDPERLIHEDKRFHYGEQRFQLVGKIEGRVFVIVYALRGQITRIISARKANKREVKRYENRTLQT